MEYKVGDKVVLLKVDVVDESSGLKVGNIYTVQNPYDCGYVIIAERLDTPHSNWKGWGPVKKDQIKLITHAAIVHDHLIRDDNYQYWSLSDTGKLICVGSELEVEEDQNGYECVADIQAAWNILVEDGYINESN